MLFDSHCHLEENMDFADVANCVCIGCDIPTSLDAISWSKKDSRVYATVGFHPEFADIWNEEAKEEIKKLSKEEKVVAIGEIGLDYHWDDNPSKELQRKCFEEQIELAKELSLPICIHSRDADQETMDILKIHNAFDSIKVLLHCFSGSSELAKEYIKLGAWISIAGPVTYKNNKKTIEVVKVVPIDRLLVETDSPYLTPEPLRGQKNCPNNVRFTAMKIAEIKEMEFEEVAKKTFENACSFYGI